ncbi:DinB family protein [Nocardioides sambongensis]|uniref:DinB family protein n=1 Tax=Nocardioides sambongensis TaxID=2589074 RepID=UPI00112B3279|nr:DinB family protein [Nocardioides sambongensis]
MDVDFHRELLDQLQWHWTNQLRPRLDVLTDAEYFWEPVDACWSIRPRGDGTFSCDWAPAEPSPPPVTTIAWRLAHISILVLGLRVATHFEGVSQQEYGERLQSLDWPGSAVDALARLDEAYDRWVAGVHSWGEHGIAEECGEAEGPWARRPRATLVLHINREVIHHGAEIATLRDLYRASNAPTPA